MEKFVVYILSSNNNRTLYVGLTNDLKRRMHEHRTHDNQSFTSRYHCYKLVYYEEGSEAKALEIARNLKALGVEISVIVQSSGLSEEQITTL